MTTDPKKPDPKKPDPKAEPTPEGLETIPGQAPPAGGSVGPPPSQSPFEPAPDEKKAPVKKPESKEK
jgi:hypothetical protein